MAKTALTTARVATILGASRQHVADLADRGQIRSWRAGSHRRFHPDDVTACLARPVDLS
jgi:excisionase family DNA binding protein